MTKEFQQLTTERLLLRQLTATDAQVIFDLRSNDEVNKYLDRPKALHISDAEKHIDRITQAFEKGNSFFWMIDRKDTGEAIGSICIWNINIDEKHGELGYEMLPKHHGKGYMNEAIGPVIDFAFNQLGLEKLFAWTHSQNSASEKLLQKYSFQRDPDEELKFKSEIGNLFIYSRTK